MRSNVPALMLPALLAALLLGPTMLHADSGIIGRKVPATLVDHRDNTIDVELLARKNKLLFVTLKATGCPVCREQLVRLNRTLARLRSCGASFIVISPGPREDLEKIAASVGFPFPFVEDVELALARGLGLQLSPSEIRPAIFAVNAEREVVWIQHGRSGQYYGDDELLDYLNCRDFRTARRPVPGPDT